MYRKLTLISDLPDSENEIISERFLRFPQKFSRKVITFFRLHLMQNEKHDARHTSKKTYKSPSILSANRKSRWRPCEKGLYRTLRHSPKELRVRPSSEIYGIKAIPY